MFANPGTADSAPHWHYVSCGLTDLHGDARVHPPATSPEAPSGYGFELSFRLRREPNQNQPPTWPAALLNSIAKYVFESENKLVAGDHINWSKPLDRGTSALRHLLVAKDPQLEQFSTGLGTVRFLQLIGVSEEELKSVQRWNGEGITELLRASPATGGSLLVTDPARQSIFDMRPEVK
jgi:suppressor of fused-like protein